MDAPNLPFRWDVVTPDQKKEIIAYLKSFEDTPNYGGATLGQYGPVSEGFFAWTVGIGGCVAFAVWAASHTTRSKKKKGVQS